MHYNTLGFIQKKIILIVILLLVIVVVFMSVFFKILPSGMNSDSNAPAQRYLEMQKKGAVKSVNIMPSGLVPETTTLDQGDLINITNTTSETINLKINIMGGVTIPIPAGRTTLLSNFDKSGTYTMQDTKNTLIKGKVVVK